MKQLITKFFLLLFFLLTVNCGFKVINESEKNNFTIQEIKTSGNKRINFKIKNNLLSHSIKDKQNILKGCYWLHKPETSKPIILICTKLLVPAHMYSPVFIVILYSDCFYIRASR